eukprot:11153527-Alexandrium_andersonii.AAC.1
MAAKTTSTCSGSAHPRGRCRGGPPSTATSSWTLFCMGSRRSSTCSEAPRSAGQCSHPGAAMPRSAAGGG